IGLFASAYSRTWLASQTDQADYAAAADLRVEPSQRSGSVPAMQLAGAYGGLEGVRAAVPVYRDELSISDSSGSTTLLGVDAKRTAGAVTFREDLASRPLGAMLDPLSESRPRLAEVPLPGRPTKLALDAAVEVGSLPASARSSAAARGRRSPSSSGMRTAFSFASRRPASA